MDATHLLPLPQCALNNFEIRDIAQIVLYHLIGVSGTIRLRVVAIGALGSFTRRTHCRV